MTDFLTMLATVAMIFAFALLVFPAVMAFAERVRDRLLGKKETGGGE